jgi:hypothetical protein
MGTFRWVGLGATAVIVAVVWLFFRGTSDTDLGSVSTQWIAEQRKRK